MFQVPGRYGCKNQSETGKNRLEMLKMQLFWQKSAFFLLKICFEANNVLTLQV